MNQYPIPAVGAIIIRDGQILLVLRGNGPYQRYWSVPGGKVEWGETLEAAVQREVWEETGLTIQAGALAGAVDLIIRDNEQVITHHVIIDYFAEVTGGELHPGSDAPDVRWVPLNELCRLDVTPQLIEMLERVGVL